MVIEPEVLFNTLRGQLVGHRLSFRRLACDSLLLYIDCDPGDSRGVTVWLEPVWHLRNSTRVLLGSMQVHVACDSAEAMASIADDALGPLIGSTVNGVAIDPVTFDLTLVFEDGRTISTFVADATTNESWHIRENESGTRLTGSPMGLSVCGPKG